MGGTDRQRTIIRVQAMKIRRWIHQNRLKCAFSLEVKDVDSLGLTSSTCPDSEAFPCHDMFIRWLE